jgi:hypothetical protein
MVIIFFATKIFTESAASDGAETSNPINSSRCNEPHDRMAMSFPCKISF